MKKIIFSFLLAIGSLVALAQGEAEETSGNVWSDEIKTYWLISIILLSLFLTARTFRNKPDA